MLGKEVEISPCYNCGNTVPLSHVATHESRLLYEHIDNRRHYEKYELSIYRCPTCDGLSVYGDFAEYPQHQSLVAKRQLPIGPALLPPAHMLASRDCIPERIVRAYEEIWPLRCLAPTAFVGQIRRALEYVCQDQHATGKSLAAQLEDLARRGTFPGNFREITHYIRKAGNIGAHATETDMDVWDAETLDDFFRSIIEYVYIAPSKLARFTKRMAAES
jgi:hypothetical protein